MAHSIRIKKISDISVNELKQKHFAGYSVEKTPHIGNFSSNAMIFTQAGIPIKIFDRNMMFVDNLFYPEAVILDGKQHFLCEQKEVMSQFALLGTEDVSEYVRENFSECTSVNEVHMSSLKQVFSQASFVLHSDYLQLHKDLVMNVCIKSLHIIPDLWRRYVEIDGTVTRHDARKLYPENIQKELYGVTANYGWVIPNQLNVFLEILIEIQCSVKKDVLYSIGDAGNLLYLQSYQNILSELYAFFQEEYQLPGSVDFFLIDSLDLRFAVPMSKKPMLDTLFELYQKEKTILQKKKESFISAQNQEEKDNILKIFYEEVAENKKKIQKILIDLPELFYEIEEGSFFSQHDLFSRNEKLYVPDWALALKIAELSKWYQELKKLLIS